MRQRSLRLLSPARGCILLLTISLSTSALCAQGPSWHDGFETYSNTPGGVFPFPQGGWIYGQGNSNISVDTSIAGEGNQSMRLYGANGGCWSAHASHLVSPVTGTYAPEFSLEFLFRNDGVPIYGPCRVGRAAVDMATTSSWTGRHRFLFECLAGGEILLADNKVYGKASHLDWHRVRIDYCRMSDTSVKLVYRFNNALLASMIVPAAPEEDQMAWLQFMATKGYSWYDDVRVSPLRPIVAAVDVKPQSCPNPVNVKARGFIPVSLMSTASFDVAKVDIGSIRLAGVAPAMVMVEDVATPHTVGGNPNACLDCSLLGADGGLDLLLLFDHQAVVTALGAVVDGECRKVVLQGQLQDKSRFAGSDTIRVVNN